MAIDPSIIFQAQSPQIMDPLTVQAKQLQIGDLMGRQQLQQQQIQQGQREQQEYQTLADLYRNSNGDPTAIRAGMAQAGLGARIPAFDQQQAALQKLQVENQGGQWKLQKEKLDATGAALSSLLANPQVDHQTVIGTIVNLAQHGVITPQQGQQMVSDLPGKVEQLRPYLMQQGLQVMDASKRLELLAPKLGQMDVGGSIVPTQTNQLTGQITQGSPIAKTATPGELLTQSTAIRGQDMADRRAREALQTTLTKPFEVTDPATGQPMLVQQDKTGAITPVQGFQPKGMGATKLTEDQSNATRFAARMQDASKIIDALEAKGVSGSDLSTQAAGNQFTNWLASSDGQQYRQAQENWVTANLRKESGAAIGKDEMSKDVAKWFPKVGDSPEVKQQKAAARRVAEEGMLVSAGPGAKQVKGILDRAAAGGQSGSAAPPPMPQGWSIQRVN